MASASPHSIEPLRFVPSRVDGLPSVTEVGVFPDRIELLSEGRAVTIRLDDIAEWPRPRWLWRLRRPRFLPVGDRDWFHDPPDRFFRFFTTPPITVYMPDESGVEYDQTVFRRLQDVIAAGGFVTHDLG
jgi:hypothetical protein